MDCSGEEKAPSRQLSRSQLLQRAGAPGAAAAVPAALAAPDTALAKAELAELRQMKALSPGDAGTIAAVCERLIPTDASGPGAKEANVVRYIDRALAGDLRAFRPAYVAAVTAINSYSQSKFGGWPLSLKRFGVNLRRIPLDSGLFGFAATHAEPSPGSACHQLLRFTADSWMYAL